LEFFGWRHGEFATEGTSGAESGNKGCTIQLIKGCSVQP
jgi:hypothetical protein